MANGSRISHLILTYAVVFLFPSNPTKEAVPNLEISPLSIIDRPFSWRQEKKACVTAYFVLIEAIDVWCVAVKILLVGKYHCEPIDAVFDLKFSGPYFMFFLCVLM